mmetsp:Transcript_18446/g.51668  ORF Transcript_18446/g.51668 Transcript_18446/m.51668 type:complete len:718 (-) Transcript_18446:1514-3667(-)
MRHPVTSPSDGDSDDGGADSAHRMNTGGSPAALDTPLDCRNDGLASAEDQQSCPESTGLGWLQAFDHCDEEDGSGDTDVADGTDGDEEESDHAVGSDSSEDERPNRNTIGNVPLNWYEHEDHIGYDRDGLKISKSERRDRLEEHLAKQDGGKAWRTIYDEYNDQQIILSKEEIQMIQRIRAGRFPHLEVDPFPEYNDFFTKDRELHPVLNLPEPKSRFVRSKWEEKKIVKLVRAMRKGWLKRQDSADNEQEEPLYLMWEEDNKIAEKTAVGLSYIPPPKLQLPGHDQSYNPPQEYLPNEDEQRQWEEADEEDRSSFLPTSFESLRKVPMYEPFIRERFERCLDMYLCPRTRKKRIDIDPQSLVPKLPKAQDLQPYPSTMCIEYLGHTAKVTCISLDMSGQWLASGSADGTVRLWEVSTGRCSKTWSLGFCVETVAWCPDGAKSVVSAGAGTSLFLLNTGLAIGKAGGNEWNTIANSDVDSSQEEHHGVLVQWRQYQETGIEIVHKFPVRSVTWHSKGDYFATVSPAGNTQAIIIHQLSKKGSQNPFRKNRGRVQRVLFHPLKPFIFVATSNHVRVYNMAKQALAKKLIGGSGVITSMDVHPGGNNVIVGCEDNRLLWFDMDLSTKPYRSLKYHSKPVRGATFHKAYPLFATSSDDGTVQVFHGMVYSDLMTNPLIVPLKILRGHETVDYQVRGHCMHPGRMDITSMLLLIAPTCEDI